MTRLHELEVEGFKKIRVVRFQLRKGITEISGRNGAGKSSILDSIAVWLDGMKVAPEKPIRTGCERARIRGRLGEMIVSREIRQGKNGKYTTSITFQPVEGKPYPATQRQLEDLIGAHHLDPLDFLTLDKRGKWDALKAFVPGFDFQRCANDQAADFARRTDVNRIAKEARAAASLILVPEGTPEEPVDEQALVQQLQAAGDANAELEARKGRREQAVRDVAALRQKAADALNEIEPTVGHIQIRTADQVGEIDRRIRELEQQIASLRERSNSLQAEALEEIKAEEQRLRETSAAHAAAADALQKRLDEAPELPAPVDTVALAQRIEAARLVNQAVTRAQERVKHAATAEKYEAESEQLTEQMKAREAAKRNAIASAKLPIPGIDFGDGEILYQGEPLEQASTAQKFRVAIARIVALNPELRLAWIRDASLLDDESYQELAKLAEEFDVDILLETVRPIGGDAVVLEDGRIKAEGAAESAA
jgi:energy-coupling factor transporter ATP-binding protein EcfA2